MIRMSMLTRFKLGALFCIFIVIFFGVFSIYHLHFLNEEVQERLSSDLRLIRFVESASRLCDDVQNRVTTACQASSAVRLAEVITFLEKARHDLETDFSEPIRRDAGIDDLFKELTEYAVSIEELASGPLPALPDGYLRVYNRYRSFANKLESFWTSNLTLLTTRQENLKALGKSFQMRIGIVAVSTILAAIIMSLFFSHQIAFPLRRLRDIIDSIRDGNYEISVGARLGNDEISQIFSALAHMAEHIAIRDRLKLEKIDVEKRRFAMLANYIGIPLFLINDENKIAFANNEFLSMFKLSWDDIYEIDLNLAPIHPKLKERIQNALSRREWPNNDSLTISCETYTYDLNISLLPVKKSNNEIASVICLLGKSRKAMEKSASKPRPQQ